LRGVGIGFVRRVVSSAPPGRNGMRANRDHGFRFAPPVATRLGPSGATVLRGQGAPGPRCCATDQQGSHERLRGIHASHSCSHCALAPYVPRTRCIAGMAAAKIVRSPWQCQVAGIITITQLHWVCTFKPVLRQFSKKSAEVRCSGTFDLGTFAGCKKHLLDLCVLFGLHGWSSGLSSAQTARKCDFLCQSTRCWSTRRRNAS